MKIPLGMSLPHRSPDPIDMTAVRGVAQRADALGFRDLWVTENAVDHVFSFDPAVVLPMRPRSRRRSAWVWPFPSCRSSIPFTSPTRWPRSTT